MHSTPAGGLTLQFQLGHLLVAKESVQDANPGRFLLPLDIPSVTVGHGQESYIHSNEAWVPNFLLSNVSGLRTPPSSNRLLTSGWWQFSRKPVRIPNNFLAWLSINLETQNYVADWIMSFTWGLVVGTASPIPYFYSVFFITVLIHRTTRDFERYANFFLVM
jgi:hypothetical protein